MRVNKKWVIISITIFITLSLFFRKDIVLLASNSDSRTVNELLKAVAFVSGNSDLNLKIAYNYKNGNVYKKDINKARKYFIKAYDQNNVIAAYELYQLTKNTDPVKAFDYIYVSTYVDQSNENSLIDMAKVYENGSGTNVDNLLAYKFYKKAFELNNFNMDSIMGMSRISLKEESLLPFAVSYLELASDLGSPIAKYNLGALYYEGKIVSKDYLKSEDLLYSSYLAGNSDAALSLGINFKDKVFKGDKNYTKAIFFLNESVNMGNIKAKYYLAEMYYKGYGTSRDIAKGESILRELIGTEYEALASVKLLTFSNSEDSAKLIKSAMGTISVESEENVAQVPVIVFDNINKDSNIFIKQQPVLLLSQEN